MTTEEKYHSLYMDIALRTSEQSHAKRLKVGAVFVATSGIITIGYNGTLPGHDNCCEDVKEDAQGQHYTVTKPDVIHAEINALMKMLRHGSSTVGSVGFLTHSPCMDCSKAIVLAGVKEIYYNTAYRSDAGTLFLKNAGVDVHQYHSISR